MGKTILLASPVPIISPYNKQKARIQLLPTRMMNQPFFQRLPQKLAREYAWCYNPKLLISMTAADGWLGLAGAKARIPSLLVCHTSVHETLLTAHLREQLFRDMQDPADVTYDPTIANIIQDFLAKDKKTGDAGKAAGSSGESQKGKQNDGGAQQPGVKAGTKKKGKKRRESHRAR